MQIIQEPKRSPKWAQQFTCTGSTRLPGCGAVLLVERDDLSVEHEHDIYGPRDRVVASCCICGAKIVVEDKLSPAWGDLPKATKPS